MLTIRHPNADFWARFRAGLVREKKIGVDLDPKTQYSYGFRAHLNSMRARNYKTKKKLLQDETDQA